MRVLPSTLKNCTVSNPLRFCCHRNVWGQHKRKPTLMLVLGIPLRRLFGEAINGATEDPLEVRHAVPTESEMSRFQKTLIGDNQ